MRAAPEANMTWNRVGIVVGWLAMLVWLLGGVTKYVGESLHEAGLRAEQARQISR